MANEDLPKVCRLAWLALAAMVCSALPALGQFMTATATATPSIGQASLTVQLDASATLMGGFPPSSPTYTWNFGDGKSGTGQSVHHTYVAPGTYTAMVTVEDWPYPPGGPEDRKYHWHDPVFATAGVTVTVLPDFFVVVPTADPTTGPIPLTVAFKTTISGGGFSPFKYLWDFGDYVGTSTASNPSYTYTIPGSYAAKVTVTDSQGMSSTGIVTIFAASTGLIVSTSAAPTSGYAPLGVSFSASASVGTGPYTYSWTFGDGGTGTGSSPSHTYVNPGSYAAMVKVSDSTGRWTVSPAAGVTAYPQMVGPPMP